MHIVTITDEYIKERIRGGMRNDKRGLMSYRDITIGVGTMPNAEGSAEVNMGNTKVLAGIKIDLSEPMRDTPGEGNLVTSAELLPMASDKFDAGPPSPESIEVARVIDRGIRASGMIDTGSLFIEEGKVWTVYIDIYVLNYDGNLFDAGTLASVSALRSARMPKYENGAVVREGNLQRMKTANMCTSCTFGKIGSEILLDTDGSEESFTNARLTIANDSEYVRAMQKGIGGSFTLAEIDKLMEATFEKSKDLRSLVTKASGGD